MIIIARPGSLQHPHDASRAIFSSWACALYSVRSTSYNSAKFQASQPNFLPGHGPSSGTGRRFALLAVTPRPPTLQSQPAKNPSVSKPKLTLISLGYRK